MPPLVAQSPIFLNFRCLLLQNHMQVEESLGPVTEQGTQVWSSKNTGRGRIHTEMVPLFMLAAQILEEKALRDSSTYAGCCLHTLPMP